MTTHDYRRCKTIESKVKFFENLQLKPLENFIKEQFKLTVKFKKVIRVDRTSDTVSMKLISEDIKKFAGTLKYALKELNLVTFGSISFKTKENEDKLYDEIVFPDITFSYEFIDGGFNGHHCVFVNFDLHNSNWYLKSIKDNYKATHAYDGTYKAYEEAYETDRTVEIKENDNE